MHMTAKTKSNLMLVSIELRLYTMYEQSNFFSKACHISEGRYLVYIYVPPLFLNVYTVKDKKTNCYKECK